MPNTRPQPQIIALIGLSGAGKSSVGRVLAVQLGWELIDIDQMIEQRAGRRIPLIFAEDGEQHFRDLEAEALRLALASPYRIIATGAGAILRPDNRPLLRQHALVIWLNAPTETLIARLHTHDENRPLLAGDDPAQRLETLRANRTPLYIETAHIQIETAGSSHAEIAAHIRAALHR
jgi:shikimate kinase